MATMSAPASDSPPAKRLHLPRPPASPPPPPPPDDTPAASTSLVPSTSSPTVSIPLQRSLEQLTHSALSTLSTLRSSTASPSLLPRLQRQLDAHQAAFADSTAALAPDLLSVTSDYSARLDGYSEEARAVSYSVARALSTLSAASSSTTSQAIHRLHTQHTSLQHQLTSTQTAIAALSLVQDVLSHSTDLTAAVASADFPRAVDLHRRVRAPMQRLREVYGMGSSKVFRHMEDEVTQNEASLTSALTSAIQRAVQAQLIDPAESDLSSSSSALLLVDPSVPLTSLFAAAYDVVDVTTLLVPAVMRVVRAVVEYATKVGVEHRWSMWPSSPDVLHLPDAVDQLCSHLSLPSLSLGFPPPTAPYGAVVIHPTPHDDELSLDIFHLVPFLFSFLTHHTTPMLTPSTLSALWSSLSTLLLDVLLPSTVPLNLSDLLLYPSTIRSQIAAMETALQHTFHLPPSPSPISSACDSIVDRFARNVRLSALDRCRELILDNDYRLYQEGDVKALTSMLNSYPPLFFPNAMAAYLGGAGGQTPSVTPEPTAVPVTLAWALQLHGDALAAFIHSQSPVSLHMHVFALTLWEVTVQALHALTLSTSLASSLLSIVHDCALLLLSIPSVYNVQQLEDVRLMSWLFANDCDFVAFSLQRMHQLLAVECLIAPASSRTLLSAVKAERPPSSFTSKEGLRLLAVVAPLQAQARKWRVHTLTRLRDDTLASLNAVPSFAGLDDHRHLSFTIHSLHQALHQLLQQLRALSSVSRPSTHALLARTMVELVAEGVVGRVLEVGDISVEVGKGMESVVKEVNTPEVKESAVPGLEDCEGWKRLVAVQRVIGSEQTLINLALQFDAKLFAALTKDELQRLIAALYVDSPQRQQLLAKISRS